MSLLAAAAELRQRAEDRLRAKMLAQPPRSRKAPQERNQGLEAYQIELEVQNEELLRIQLELETQKIELEMQNEELQNARAEVETARDKYTELYDFAPIAYFTFDARGVIQEANLTGALMLGIDRISLLNKPFISFMADADGREIFSGHLDAVLQSQSLQRCEIRLLGKDGVLIHGQLQSGTVGTTESGYIRCSILDGSAGKRLEIEIKEAREYAENIVETVHKPLVVLSSDLKILTANHSFYDSFQVTPEETIGYFIYDLGNRQWDIPKLRILFEEILPNDTVFNGYEVEHDFPGIGRKTILLNAREIFRKNIGSHIILLAMEDITERKQLETEIQDAREYAEDIVETVREPLVVLDSHLKILTANLSFYETFEVTPEETIGNFLYDLGNRQWDIPKLRVLVEEILPHDTVINGYEVDHDFPGIGRKVILLNARQIFREDIGSHIILLAMEDITERKQAEAERTRLEQVLQDKNTELEHATFVAEKANLAKSEFLSSMSHELRTPLGAILGFAQLIESGSPPPTPAQMRSVDQILKAGWHLLELINGILDLALIESGKLSMSLEPVSLSEVLRECQAMIEPQAQKHGIRVLFASAETAWFINVDRTRVKQVLINLLSNAIKYNSLGGTVTVESALSDSGVIRVSVRDTGAGLDPGQLTQLFQPFNRLGQEGKAEEGTGIGLVVCKRLVELMGGGIGVESSVGQGSVFWFELNRIDGPLPAGVHAAEPTTVAPVQGKSELRTHTLLYIEDNPANLMLVEDIVARRPDIRFLSARDALRGIEMAHASLPDVILMDINLPGISGLQALRILAEDPATAHIPVVALSANAIPRDIEKGLEAGFFRYLTKPIKVDKFMDTLDEALKFATTEAASAAADKEPGQCIPIF